MKPDVAPALHRVSTAEMRACMGRFPTGVTVLTAGTGEAVRGVTVSALMSVSLQPPLIAAGLNNHSRFLGRLKPGTGFAVNVMADHQIAVARRFASTRPDGPAAFHDLPWRTGRCTGAPLLCGSVAWLECHVADLVPAGDHHIVIGAVDRADAGAGSPLLHHASHLRGLDAAPDAGTAPGAMRKQEPYKEVVP